MAVLVLLGFYLTDVYRSEEASVSKEARYIFLNAVDNVRGDALEKLLQKIGKDSIADSISIFAYKKDALGEKRMESTLRIEVATDSTGADEVIKESWEIRETDEVLNQGEGFKMKFYNDSDFTVAVDDRMRDRLKDAGLNIRYDILMNDSSTLANEWEDGELEERFEFTIQQSPMSIVSKMWKEILFSIIVFLLVTLSLHFLEKSYLEQVRMNEERNQFVQNMTHELKSPVSAISLALEAMESFGTEEEEQRKTYLSNTRNEIRRLDGLIDKVMETSVVNSRHLEASDFEKINLCEVLEVVVNRLKSSYLDHNLILDDEDISATMVSANRYMLEAIIGNILENALKYSGTTPTQIKISTALKENNVAIDIIDDGQGVDQDIAPYIFDRFYRGQKGNVYDVSGHGLGLSLARDYAQTMGGDLQLIQEGKNDQWQGAHFRLTLPKV